MFKCLLYNFDFCTYRKVVLGNLMHLNLTYWSFSLSDVQSEMTGFVWCQEDSMTLSLKYLHC